MKRLPIPRAVDEAMEALGRQRGLARDVETQVFSLGRYVIRAFSEAAPNESDLAKAYARIERCLALLAAQPSADPDAPLTADLRRLAGALEAASGIPSPIAREPPAPAFPASGAAAPAAASSETLEVPMPPPVPGAFARTADADFLWHVLEEHLDEAEFLVEQWLAAARSPRLSAADAQRTVERRLVPHLDGLIVGGAAVAERLLWPILHEGTGASMARVAAAAAALLMDPEAAAVDRLIDLLRHDDAGDDNDDGPLRAGLCRAFQITARDQAVAPLRLALQTADSASAQRVMLTILAARRLDPGPILDVLLGSADPRLLIAAVSAAAAAAEPRRYHHLIEPLLSHPQPLIRAAALRTGLVGNLRSAWQACGAEARAGAPEALLFSGCLGGPAGVSALIAALGVPGQRGAALHALGFAGTGEAVEACLPFLDDPDGRVARLAFEAIASVTGLPLHEPPFALPDGEHDEASALPPLDKDLQTDLGPSPLDDVPRPDAVTIRQWWSERRPAFVSGQRYLRGSPLSATSVALALREGPLRRSGPLALEIAIRTGGRVRLPAFRLGYPPPAIPPDLALDRPPIWQ